MKKNLVFLASLFISLIARTQSWQPVGADDFNQASLSNAGYTSITMDGDGVPYIAPYVAHQDGGNGGRATVEKYDGSNWVSVGTAGFSAGNASFVSMAVDGSGTLYVSYEDGGNSNKATVKKFDGASWVDVGSAGFTAGAVDYTSVAINPAATPIVVYSSGGVFAKSFGFGLLPLSLLDFNAYLSNNAAVLKWRTTNEVNTLKFVIERSTNGHNYSSIGTEVSYNSDGIHEYDFIDPSVLTLNTSSVYYRLKQVDVDDHFRFSPVSALSLDLNKALVLLYPNPAKTTLNVSLSNSAAENIEYRLIDINGRIVKQGTKKLSRGANSFSVDISRLSPARYHLKMDGTTTHEQFQFIKQ